ncbi:phosphotransferase enzyme family protein [Streptomyces olivoreticuli]|uniref:phosphotransferase enzyme family protein n=1 Tax=Streptomyces olivoreticuli TaxID=68246 RepID=UPI000E259E04|nr:aminoglycoside phosphotransferase family protein [Streptomyces olivoreticuli]
MTGRHDIPAEPRAWAERLLGPLLCARDASRARPGSRLWELARSDGARFFLKLSPSAVSFTRETFAYRHAVPALGGGHAPQLVESDAGLLALLLTALPGAPVPRLRLTSAEHRTAHRRAGALLARLHEVDQWTSETYAEAKASLRTAADGAERYLGRGGLLSAQEQKLVRDSAEELRLAGPVPLGFVHGDARPQNLLWSGRHTALIDFERSRFAAAVQDFTAMTCGTWAEHPDRRAAFFTGYGRQLTTEERRMLRCLAAVDATSRLASGPPGAARGRRTLERLASGEFTC